ncbi:receptor-interacting serine/threonine-protein kinase 2-like [Arapaima gigas]
MTESGPPLRIPERDLENLELWRTRAGACLRASYRVDGRRVYVRLLRGSSDLDRWWREHVRDVLMVRQLRSERLLVPLGLYGDWPHVGVVSSWMEGGSLHALLYKTQVYPQLPIALRISILLDVAEGLSHLHALGLPHLILRPTNVLLDSQYRAKVCDWGLQWTRSSGSAGSAGRTSCVRDLVYMSPELLRGDPPSLQADMYSFGVMLLETLNRRPPTEGTCNLQMPQSLASCWPGSGTATLHRILNSLIVQCGSTDPQSRPSAAECVLELQKALATFDPEAATRAVHQITACKERVLLGCKEQQTTGLKVDIKNLELNGGRKDEKRTYIKTGLSNLFQMVAPTPQPSTANITQPTSQHAFTESASSFLPAPGRLRSQSAPEYWQQNEPKNTSYQQGSSSLPTPTPLMGFRPGCHDVPVCFLSRQTCCQILQERREAIVHSMTEGRLNNLLDVLRSKQALSREEYELIMGAVTLAARTRSLLDTCLCLGEGVARLVAFTLGLFSMVTTQAHSHLSLV